MGRAPISRPWASMRRPKKVTPDPCGTREERRAAAAEGIKAPQDCRCPYHRGL